MSADQGNVEVYRRRSRVEQSTDRNRLIGGLGKKRSTTSSNLQERIKHFATGTDSFDKSKDNLSPATSYVDIGRPSPSLARRRSNTTDSTNSLSRQLSNDKANLFNQAKNNLSPVNSKADIGRPSPSLARRRGYTTDSTSSLSRQISTDKTNLSDQAKNNFSPVNSKIEMGKPSPSLSRRRKNSINRTESFSRRLSSEERDLFSKVKNNLSAVSSNAESQRPSPSLSRRKISATDSTISLCRRFSNEKTDSSSKQLENDSTDSTPRKNADLSKDHFDNSTGQSITVQERHQRNTLKEPGTTLQENMAVKIQTSNDESTVQDQLTRSSPNKKLSEVAGSHDKENDILREAQVRRERDKDLKSKPSHYPLTSLETITKTNIAKKTVDSQSENSGSDTIAYATKAQSPRMVLDNGDSRSSTENFSKSKVTKYRSADPERIKPEWNGNRSQENQNFKAQAGESPKVAKRYTADSNVIKPYQRKTSVSGAFPNPERHVETGSPNLVRRQLNNIRYNNQENCNWNDREGKQQLRDISTIFTKSTVNTKDGSNTNTLTLVSNENCKAGRSPGLQRKSFQSEGSGTAGISSLAERTTKLQANATVDQQGTLVNLKPRGSENLKQKFSESTVKMFTSPGNLVDQNSLGKPKEDAHLSETGVPLETANAFRGKGSLNASIDSVTKDENKISSFSNPYESRNIQENFVVSHDFNKMEPHNIPEQSTDCNVNTISKKSKPDKTFHANQKQAPSLEKVNKRFQNLRDRCNTWTTTDSDIDQASPQSSEDSKCRKTKETDSSCSANDKGEKEPNRRKRLKKKRSERNKARSNFVAKISDKSVRTKSIDTSDGDILESNYTTDENRRADSDIESEADDVLVDSEPESSLSPSTAKQNIENLTSQLTDNKNNKKSESTYQIKSQLKDKNAGEYRESTTRDKNVVENSMKSASLTAVSFHNFSSYSTNDMGSRSEDEGSKLANWGKLSKEASLGSFSSISKVSTLKLQSFAGKSPFLGPKRRSLSTDFKQYSTSSYTDISESHLNNIKNPFSLETNNIQNAERTLSDSEPNANSGLNNSQNKEDGCLKRSYTLPKNMKLQNFDIHTSPFSLTREQTEKEKEDAARAAEVLNSLPDSPFSLIGRFTRDTQRLIQSRTSGNGNDNDLTPEISIDDEDDEFPPNIERDFESNNNENEAAGLNSITSIPDSNNNEDVRTSDSPKSCERDDILEKIVSNNETNRNKKIKSRPPLKLSLSSDSESNSRTILDSPAPLRRPSYMIAHSSEDMGDPMSRLNIPITKSEDQNENLKKQARLIRPRVPGMLATSLAKSRDEPQSPIAKEDSESDSDEIPVLDFSRVEKVDTSSRNRTQLSQPPLLAGIPEERGRKDVHSDDHGRRRKGRKPAGILFPEETITEEPNTQPDCDSPKTDERETGYHSQGSDLLSTPKLSCEDLSSDNFEKDDENNILDNNSNSKTDNNISNTKCESTVSILSNDSHKHSRSNDSAYNSLSTLNSVSTLNTSISDPNLSKSANEHLKTDNKATVSTTSLRSHVKESTLDEASPEANNIQTDQTPPTPKKKTPKIEMRRHVLQNLLDTEQSYVTNLNFMINMFFKPLKRSENSNIVDPGLVDEIFFQIPEICASHEIFLDQVKNRVNNWSDQQIIGDVFVSSFTKCMLMDAYSSFITHYIDSKEALRQAQTRPQFVRFMDNVLKDHREKYTIAELMITPVQRIPRYQLLLNDMLKYTPVDHPDYGNLQLALEEIKTLADRMNKGEMEADQAERHNERIRDIENTIEGIVDLVSSNRRFIRQDLVAESRNGVTKKDRCLFLFSDLLVCTTVRRKNNALRRGSIGLFTGQSAADINRFKFLWKLPLDNIDVVKANNPQATTGNKEIEKLEEDIRTLAAISTTMESLSVPHQNIDIAVRDVVTEVKTMIQEKQLQATQRTLSPMLSKIELHAKTESGTEAYNFIFLSAECKSSWEVFFEDAKQKLAFSKGTFPPEFQYPMPINKTRSGMQFTCAAPSYISALSNVMNQKKIQGDVWICNSDGYVGQVCLLTMIPEAHSKASLSVCASRIVCVCAVPGGGIMENQPDIRNMDFPSRSSSRKSKSKNGSLKSKKSTMSDSDNDEDINRGAQNIIAFDSTDEEPDGDLGSPYLGGPPSSFGGRMSPDGSSLGTVESLEGVDQDSTDDFSSDDEPVQSIHMRPVGRPHQNYPIKDKSSLDDYETENPDEEPTMWLGTEDGHIYVYRARNAITQRKSKVKLEVDGAVTAILYFENKVFVALSTGELCMYQRDPATSNWNIYNPQTIHVSITGSAIVCVTAVAGRIWCACQNTVVLVNASTLKTESTITVTNDYNKLVQKIVSSGLGVWVSTQGSPTIRLYHATTYENLADIDVSPAVNKMLAGADAIIRQHKAACLRVTSLLICKDLLWIGTSAGVILTNPLPSITASTSVLRHSIGPTGSPHGHTGHVRFLTSVEVPASEFKLVDSEKESRTTPSPSNLKTNKKKVIDRNSNNRKCDDSENDMLTLVVSGGDGYEDFRYNQQTDSVGRDDSTNHLLIWRV